MNDIASAPDTIAAPILKISTAWAAVGITSWSDAAGFMAALYTAVLLGEWIWKKIRRQKTRKGSVNHD